MLGDVPCEVSQACVGVGAGVGVGVRRGAHGRWDMCGRAGVGGRRGAQGQAAGSGPNAVRLVWQL